MPVTACRLPGFLGKAVPMSQSRFSGESAPVSPSQLKRAIFILGTGSMWGFLPRAPTAPYLKNTVCFFGGKLEAGPKTQVDMEAALQALAAEARQSLDSIRPRAVGDTGLAVPVWTGRKEVDRLKVPTLGPDLC